MARSHVRREDQQIAFRIVAVKCVAAIGRSLAARRQRQHMVFLQKPYDPRIDAGFMPGFLRPGVFRCIPGFPVCPGAPVFCRGVPVVPRLCRVYCPFPGWLPSSSCRQAFYRTVPDPGLPACRPADVPCLSLRSFSPLFRCLRCCRLRDDERIELRDALPSFTSPFSSATIRSRTNSNVARFSFEIGSAGSWGFSAD